IERHRKSVGVKPQSTARYCRQSPVASKLMPPMAEPDKSRMYRPLPPQAPYKGAHREAWRGCEDQATTPISPASHLEAPRTSQPRLWTWRKYSTISVVIFSPGARTGTPGGYGQTISLE